jgi:TRAP-type mannitol/chloroaromatic compound transport system permease small subunit
VSGGTHPLIKIADACSQHLSSVLSWMPLAMAGLTVYVVVLRYGFGLGAITAQEGVIYLHSALFMLGASCTLFADEHVRVDVFYRSFSTRQKAWVNALGHVLFTLPLCAVIAASSMGYVGESWMIRESSPEPGGIPAVFLLKTLIPVTAALLAMQALAEVCRALSQLVGEPQDG